MKTNFVRGDVIRYAGDLYIVLDNYGRSGRVREYPTGDECGLFYWEFQGETSEFVRHVDLGAPVNVLSR